MKACRTVCHPDLVALQCRKYCSAAVKQSWPHLGMYTLRLRYHDPEAKKPLLRKSKHISNPKNPTLCGGQLPRDLGLSAEGCY